MAGSHMMDGKRKDFKNLYGELNRVHVKLAAHSFASKIFAKGI